MTPRASPACPARSQSDSVSGHSSPRCRASAPETAPGTVRLAHLHRNVPGVLAAINRVLADAGVNIEGQQLATRGDLGYVVTDIAAHASEEVGRRLRDLPEMFALRGVFSAMKPFGPGKPSSRR